MMRAGTMLLAVLAIAYVALRLRLTIPSPQTPTEPEATSELGDYGYPRDGSYRIGRASSLIH